MKSENKMEAKSKKLFGITAGLFLFFTVFTLMVLLVDVQPIGPEESKVGLATINQSVFECFGVNFLCYEITEWLGMIAVLFALGFAVLGLVQLVKRKNLWEVDYEIILLGMFYILVAVIYLFFEIAIVNYRPVMMDNSLEASYPSSTTMLAMCVLPTAMMQFKRLIKNHKFRNTVNIICGLFTAFMVIGRLVCGVHWFTDILGGLIFSIAVILLYCSANNFLGLRDCSVEQ